MTIQKTAILGAGTMGSAIAAHMANAGVDVILLDRVPDKAGNRRSRLAEDALRHMKEGGKHFTHPDHALRISCGNFEDDMEWLADCDWIIEAVVEDRNVKKDLFRRVDRVRRPDSIVSSNTSTLLLRDLKEGQSDALKKDLIITHFFNPPRRMRLLELVSGAGLEEDEARKKMLLDFADRNLGKIVVETNDTPGFIGNRLGIFWIMAGLEQALAEKVPVSVADGVLGHALGFPKTGIFGLIDMVGVKMVRDLAHSLRRQVPEGDGLHRLGKAFSFLDDMQDSFYKKENGKTRIWNLQKGGYGEPPPFQKKKMDLRGIVTGNGMDMAEKYARGVLLHVLNYACTCLPAIADKVEDADIAMRLGYGWAKGPFEMIESLGDKETGAERLRDALEKFGHDPAPLLLKSRVIPPFYRIRNGALFSLAPLDGYKPRIVPDDRWTLADKTRGTFPVFKNDAAELWDIGDGIACFAFSTYMGTINPHTFDLLEKSMDKIRTAFAGMVIGHDGKVFSAGLDLRLILKLCDREDMDSISTIIRRGQRIMEEIKYAPFPVVGAAFGKALGGGCELLLHCTGIQAHIDSNIGLVESRIGLVPSWGGCKEMLARHLPPTLDAGAARQACLRIFDDISSAKTSSSAHDAASQLAFTAKFGVTMNRERVLPEAKKLCFVLSRHYAQPERMPIIIPEGMQGALKQDIGGREGLTPHERKVLHYLAHIFSGGNDGGVRDAKELLILEHEAFMSLIASEETREKIRAVL